MLFRSLKIIKEKDTDISRQFFFREYLKQSSLKRMIVNVYGLLPLGLKGLALVLAALFKVMKAPRPDSNKEVFAIFWTKTEERRCHEILSQIDSEKISLHPVEEGYWQNVFSLHLFLNKRLFNLAIHLAKKHDFLIAARSLETVFYYAFFLNQLKDSKCRRVLACSDVNPYALGLFSAAKKVNIETVYANHGRIHGFTPSYYCDYNFLTYIDSNKSKPEGKVILHTGLKGELLRKKIESFSEKDSVSVGIILSMTPSLSGIQILISELLAKFPNGQIHIKHHPIKEFNYLPMLKRLVLQMNGRVTIASNQSLEEFIEGKTFIIGANTNAHIDCLLKGVRTIYCSQLDGLPSDFYGFVRDRLVPEVATANEISTEFIDDFYDQNWEDIFRKTYFSEIRLNQNF